MFDLFAWMKQLQTSKFVNQWVILDAAGYAIVNKISPSIIESLGKNPKASSILECLVNEQERDYNNSPRTQQSEVFERKKFRQNCDLRSLYLQRMLQISCFNAEYIDSRNIFRNDKRFALALDEALIFTNFLSQNNPTLVKKIIGEKSTASSQLYLPLEIAEALYLQEIKEVRGKFGPTTEIYFDESILMAQEQRRQAYSVLRCPLPPSKDRPVYLMTKDPFFLSSKRNLKAKTIKRTLSKNKLYQEFVTQYLEPFQSDDENIIGCIKRLMMLLEEVTP